MSEQHPGLDESIVSFISECREMIDEVEPQLIELGGLSSESGAPEHEITNLIFRLFHSIKGTAGFLQFNQMVRITHEAETLLDLIRSGKALMTQSNTDLLCRTCDMLNLLLDQIEATGADKGFDTETEAIIQELKSAIHQSESDVPSTSDIQPSQIEAAGETPPEDEQPSEPEEPDTMDALVLTPEMLQRFVEEAVEQLEQVESSLLEIKKDGSFKDAIQEAFRALHSFKGNCGFAGYAHLERLAHRSETLIEAIKEGVLPPEDDTIQMLLHMLDVMNQGIGEISKGKDGKIENLNVLLDLLKDSLPAEASSPSPSKRPEIEQPEALYLLREDMDLKEIQDTPAPAAPPEQAPEKPDPLPQLKSRSINRQDIRVNLDKLDQLINLVGELVIAESMVIRNPDLEGHEFENFERAAGQLDKIVRDLQDMTLSVRMVPIAGIFRKMIRLVHDLSAKAKKKVNLRLLGEDTEIDKTVSEMIADPLVHVVRNAIDHGIEPPHERLDLGKPETGDLILEAKHEGGEIWITIKDDGRGLNRDKILAKAMERGLVRDDGNNLSDEDIYDFIFHPGFSTAGTVTDVSGRGVGMDVVKKNVEKIKGHIDIRSRPGQGTILILRIPLTLAIIDGMLVRVGQALYTIPLLSIRESIQIDPHRITVTMDGQEIAKVRDELMPVIRIHELHHIKPDHMEIDKGLLVIVENRGETAALFIDEIVGEQQTVIKGLSNYVGHVKGVSGCTILGNGEISLILDIGGLIRKAQEWVDTGTEEVALQPPPPQNQPDVEGDSAR